MLCGINVPFGTVSPAGGHITYALLTRLPLSIATSFDLHVLGTPPALVLSQDQTLRQMVLPDLHLATFQDHLADDPLIWSLFPEGNSVNSSVTYLDELPLSSCQRSVAFFWPAWQSSLPSERQRRDLRRSANIAPRSWTVNPHGNSS